MLKKNITKKEKAKSDIIGRKIIHNNIEVKIEKAYISLWSDLHYAIVKDNKGQTYIVDLVYDYKDNTFYLDGDYQLPFN